MTNSVHQNFSEIRNEEKEAIMGYNVNTGGIKLCVKNEDIA